MNPTSACNITVAFSLEQVTFKEALTPVQHKYLNLVKKLSISESAIVKILNAQRNV